MPSIQQRYYSQPSNVINPGMFVEIGIVVFIIVGFCLLCWWRETLRETYRVTRQRFSYTGKQRAMIQNRDGKKPESLLTRGASPQIEEPTDPFASPLDSSESLDRMSPIPPPPPTRPNMPPSSKELRERQRERPPSLDIASTSDFSMPLSTRPSTSMWPERTDIEPPLSEEDDPYLTRSPAEPEPIPALQDPHTLQRLITRELEHIYQEPPSTGPRTTLIEVEPSDISRVWTKEGSGVETPTNPFASREEVTMSPSSTGFSRTPMSKQEMELLADMVAQRLAREQRMIAREQRNGECSIDLPPPSYSG